MAIPQPLPRPPIYYPATDRRRKSGEGVAPHHRHSPQGVVVNLFCVHGLTLLLFSATRSFSVRPLLRGYAQSRKCGTGCLHAVERTSGRGG